MGGGSKEEGKRGGGRERRRGEGRGGGVKKGEKLGEERKRGQKTKCFTFFVLFSSSLLSLFHTLHNFP